MWHIPMLANFTTLKEMENSIPELKLIMRIYSRWSCITDIKRIFHASVELFLKLGIKEF